MTQNLTLFTPPIEDTLENQHSFLKTPNSLFFETMESSRAPFAKMIQALPYKKDNGHLDKFLFDLDAKNTKRVNYFPYQISRLYYVFFQEYRQISIVVDFYALHLDLLTQEQSLSFSMIEEWYQTLQKQDQDFFINAKSLFGLLKTLFFDTSNDTQKVFIKLDILCAVLYAFKEHLSRRSVYQTHYLYFLGESLLGATQVKDIYEPIFKGIVRNKTDCFFQILREYQPRYSDTHYKSIYDLLSTDFVKMINEKVDSRIVAISLYFPNVIFNYSNAFRDFVRKYEEDFRVGIRYGVFYFDYDFLVFDAGFYDKFFRKTLCPSPVSLASTNDLSVIEKPPLKSDGKYFYAVAKEFIDTGNINKKTIDLTKSQVLEMLESFQCLDETSVDHTLALLISNKLKNIIIYKKYLGAKVEEMKNEISYLVQELYALDEMQDFFAGLSKQYANTLLDYEDFVLLLKSNCPYFFNIVLQIYWILDREICYRLDGSDFTHQVLLNNIFLEYANLGMIDTFSTLVTGEYRSMNSNGYTENPIYEYQKIKYIRFKNHSQKPQKAPDLKNSITANTLYLTPTTPNHLIQQLACCTILEKIDTYIVLTLNRETIIKANNKFEMSNSQILKLLTKDLKLSLPQNIEILLGELGNKPHDVTLVASGIPLIVSEEGTYQDLLKLKTLSNQILYKDDQMRLIVFSNKFTGLGTLLTKRNLIINKVGGQ